MARRRELRPGVGLAGGRVVGDWGRQRRTVWGADAKAHSNLALGIGDVYGRPSYRDLVRAGRRDPPLCIASASASRIGARPRGERGCGINWGTTPERGGTDPRMACGVRSRGTMGARQRRHTRNGRNDRLIRDRARPSECLARASVSCRVSSPCGGPGRSPLGGDDRARALQEHDRPIPSACRPASAAVATLKVLPGEHLCRRHPAPVMLMVGG